MAGGDRFERDAAGGDRTVRGRDWYQLLDAPVLISDVTGGGRVERDAAGGLDLRNTWPRFFVSWQFSRGS